MKHVIGILVVLITCLLVFIGIYVYGNTDGFSDASTFMTNEANNMNPLGVALIATNSLGALGSSTAALTGTPGIPESTYTLNAQPTGLFQSIAKCEAVKTTDCSVFDNKDFQTDCGICLDIGPTSNPAVNSQKVAGVGGRVVLANTRAYVESTAKNGALPAYTATVGTCPANRLVTTKAQCLTMQREMACEKNANFDLAGCVQCYSDSSYSIVDPAVTPGVINGSGTIHVAGRGALSVSFTDGNRVSITLSDTSQAIQLRGDSMTQFYLDVQSPANAPNPNINILGYLSGTTASGKFNIDLRRIISIDHESGGKPRTIGKTTLDGIDATVMVPTAYGINRMYLIGQSPFTFVESTSQEATRCPSSPFITTEAAAEFLDSDPCYKKGSGPGAFKMECLQNSFLSNGCTQNGKGYPNNAVTAGNLMTNANGSLRSLNEISNYIYSTAMITATGLLNGQDVSIADWSAASVFCKGEAIDSPCDTQAKNTGPLSFKCLASLWKNQGTKAKGIGSTYTTAQATSMVSGTNEARFCTTAGLMSPVLPNGKPNTSSVSMPSIQTIPNVLAWWQQQGGVAQVKNIMNQWHEAANSPAGAIRDSERATMMSVCYGPITLSPSASSSTTTGAKYPQGSDTGSLNYSAAYFIPKANTSVGTVNIPTGNYRVSFTIRPTSIVSGWANILHVSNGGDGSRAPGIWFWPGTTRLHIRLGDSTDRNWGVDPSTTCPIGVATPVSIVANDASITVTIGTTVLNYTQPSRRPTGNGYKVYLSDPWYTPANAIVQNFVYIVDGVSFIPRF